MGIKVRDNFIEIKILFLIGLCNFTRAFKGLIPPPPSEPPGEIMSFGVSPVNYSDSISEQIIGGSVGWDYGPLPIGA